MITAWEVTKYSPAGKDFPTADICGAIPQVVEAFGYECLGKDLYLWLVSKLQAYPDPVSEYNYSATYSTGAYVVFDGCLYKAGGAVTINTPPPNSPWAAYERFSVACANTLWKSYLRRLLAYQVFRQVVIYPTMPAGAGGVVLQATDSTGQGRKSAGKNEMALLIDRLEADIDQTTKNMQRWFSNRAKNDCEMPKLLSCDEGCPTPGKRRAKWHFKH